MRNKKITNTNYPDKRAVNNTEGLKYKIHEYVTHNKQNKKH